jgi:hypothetical protein
MSRFSVLLLSLVLSAPQLEAAPPWPALDPGEFAHATPVVDPDAGAEILLREIRIDGGSFWETSIEHFVRVRIYNQQGLEKLSKIELPYERNRRITRLEARTLKPDGTMLRLDKKDVYDREVAKVGSVRQRVKSFVPPGMEPGVIVEYRYREELSQFILFHVLAFQSDLPARLVRFHVRAVNVPGFMWRTLGFNCPVADAKPDKSGYVTFERTDLPAWDDEPYQIPKIHLQPTVLFYLREEKVPTPDRFWQDLATQWYRESQRRAKPSKPILAIAQTLFEHNDTDEAKLRKIHTFCRTEISNRSLVAAPPGTTYPENHSATDTLKRRSGWPSEIDELFIALARAAGFDAQPAYLNDRSFLLFNSAGADRFYLTDNAVAVRRDQGEWQFTQPGSDPFQPFGTIAWRNTSTAALIAAPKNAAIQILRGPPPEANVARREGRFELGADGTLEGTVALTFTGQFATIRRQNGREQTGPERIESLQDELREHMPTAEVKDVTFVHWDDISAPLVIRFNLRVPEYADRTGSRIFVQPAVFEKNAKPIFQNTTRRTDILFHHRYREEDDITIKHPAGYSLEAATAPAPVEMLGSGEYDNSIRYSRNKREIMHRRIHVLDALLVEQKHYASLKGVFDAVNATDQHTLTLRKMEEAPATEAENSGS